MVDSSELTVDLEKGLFEGRARFYLRGPRKDIRCHFLDEIIANIDPAATESLGDDFYELRTHGFSLVGERHGRSYSLGDRLEVQVARVDKEARHIDFLAIRKYPPVD